MVKLLQVARVPAIVAPPDMTVLQAVVKMDEAQVGAILIADEEMKLLGIFTERDNMLRMTLKQRNPETTRLKEVMSAPVQTASPEITPEEALNRMIKSKYRHLPIVDKNNKILGVVSVRQLLLRRVSQQESNIEVLAAYANAGGPG